MRESEVDLVSESGCHALNGFLEINAKPFSLWVKWSMGFLTGLLSLVMQQVVSSRVCFSIIWAYPRPTKGPLRRRSAIYVPASIDGQLNYSRGLSLATISVRSILPMY